MSRALYADSFDAAADPTWKSLFLSLGSNGDGTLNAWTQTGTPNCTIASHVAAIPVGTTGAGMRGGHPDLDDAQIYARIQWFTGANPCIMFRNILFYFTGTALWNEVGFSDAYSVGQGYAALTNGNWYWLRASVVGNVSTATLFADSAGAIGAQIATCTTTLTGHSSAATARSQVTLMDVGGVTGFNVGGNFVNTFMIQGPVPLGWSVGGGTGEPAFCWSAANAKSNGRSLGVYNAHSSGQGYWYSSTLPTVAGQTYTLVVQGWGQIGSAPTNFYANIAFAGGQPGNYVCDSAWHSMSVPSTPGANQSMECIAYGIGTYYFDNVGVYGGSSVALVQPTILKANGRAIAKFGNAPMPNGQGVMQYINLNDGVNTKLQDFTTEGGDHLLTLAQALYLGRSVFQGEDWGPGNYSLPMIYMEDSTHFLGDFLHRLSQAGEQWLTMDNLTYALVRYKGITGRKAIYRSPPLEWAFNLELWSPTGWWMDMTTSSLIAIIITTDAGQAFSIPYAGGIPGEPIWTLVIPSSNGVAINQMQIASTMWGVGDARNEVLTVNFLSVAAIPAGVARTVTIDTKGMSITDDKGNVYDHYGTFPKLYGPPGQANPFQVVITPASGSSSGLALSEAHTPMWQI